MSAKVIPIRRRVATPRPKALVPPYPLPDNGIHLVAEDGEWCLSKHLGGHSVAMRLTREELLRVADMIELVTTLEDA